MGTQLSQLDSPKSPEEHKAMHLVPYQALIGSLNHTAVMTCPDIMKAIQSIAQFLSNPGHKHWNATLQIVKYLNTTKDWILIFDGKSSDSIPKVPIA